MNELYEKMKKIEVEYLQPQNFKQYKNYWLPESIVKNSTNVLSFGVHRDVGFEQAMCDENPNLNIKCYDPTPDSLKLFKNKFKHRDKMIFYPEAYAKDNGKMKFYYDKNDLTKCFSLLPLPQFGENPSYIEVMTRNLTTIIKEDMPQVDIIKADIEGVWFDFCREILDNNINFKAFLVEFEVKLIDNETSIKQYENLLQEFKDKGYKLYLNRPRNKILSEAVIINDSNS
jgi:FkbM family methyltransferase